MIDQGSKTGKKIRVRARPAWTVKGPIAKELANGEHGEQRMLRQDDSPWLLFYQSNNLAYLEIQLSNA